jgi:hypothetical protein
VNRLPATTATLLPSGATVRPVQYQDLTGLQEDVLYAIGRAGRLGALVRAEPVRENPDGTVTARVHATELITLPDAPFALPGPAVPADDWVPGQPRERWETGDYVIAGLTACKYAVIGGIAYLAYVGVSAVCAWIAVNSGAILGAIGAVLAVMLLLATLGGGKGCPGIHCGGCSG